MTTASVKKSMKKASEVFGIEDERLNFDVPVFIGKHPLVPPKDKNYKFKAGYLVPVLWALVNNKKAWLSGHTGTGKSTLIAQVCAHLNWPMIRVNFDSEISRMDLVGRDTLVRDSEGATVSIFVDGILPQALVQHCVLLCDEVDFIRPDVAYVFQRALEDEGLLISEDGGRLVKPHDWFRIVATANTQGQGDDFGIYQGARAQSMAFLDRFTVWLHCDYLPEDQEKQLIKELVPDIKGEILSQVMNYVREHRAAFENLKISQPLSPRSIASLAESSTFFDKTSDNPVLDAAKMTILNKANQSDKQVLVGVLDRVTTSKKLAAKRKSEAAKAKKAELRRNEVERIVKKSATRRGVGFGNVDALSGDSDGFRWTVAAGKIVEVVWREENNDYELRTTAALKKAEEETAYAMARDFARDFSKFKKAA